ncbi:MAG: M1 family peptidase [Sporocytophaga sp.]|nr:M1 family peptidase [Sporocytophaga sp.]
MRVFLLTLLSVISFSFSFSQDFAHQSPEVPFRSKENPYYWKNNPPAPGYWQQDVHYYMDVFLDDSNNVLVCPDYKLVYYNNSPFELKELYFHLHNNAFIPGSYYHALNIENDVKVKFGPTESKGLGTVVDSVRVDGEEVKTIIDNTIMKVALNKPLKSGDSLIVTMNFKTYFDPSGSMRRRMKLYETFGFKHFDAVHWYPAIAVYDHKFAWETEQHLDKEFYSDFGAFDIKLTLPNNYVLEATGTLLNEKEVLPDTLRQKLDLKNFAKKPLKEAPSIVIPREKGKYKTWVYHAKNVHNFAFTADPLYRIGELMWNGIRVVAIAQEPNAAGWQLSAYFTANVIKVYSQDFGMYAWPKIVVADAKDGMEYSMLTLDNGTYPQHQNLLAHEVGHMWFYGMVGTNETYRAMMDEGFTQFLTVWAMDKIVGEKRARIGKNKYITKHVDSSDTRYENLYYPYLNHVVEGYDDPLNTHSSDFHGAIRHGGNYGLVYYKAGTMLYNLRYVLGDDLFSKAMKHYFNKWKFAHPYPEDFRDAITEYAQTDLNWFFDQWMETTKYIDYSIDEVKRVSKENEYEIKFRRKGSMQMPLDFRVKASDGSIHDFHIPNTWFIKKTEATILPKWYGWGKLNPSYKAEIKLPSSIKTIEIDPKHYLADIDLTNNKAGEGGIKILEFEHRVPNVTSWAVQKNTLRPDVWYNSFDGFQVGPYFKGSYFGKFQYSAGVWFNTGLVQGKNEKDLDLKHQWVAADIYLKRNLSLIWKGLSANTKLYYNAGIANLNAGLEKVVREPDQRASKYSKFFINTKYLITTDNYFVYRLYPEQWGRYQGDFASGLVNATVNLGYFHYYTYGKGNGEYTFNVRIPSMGSDYNYSYAQLNSINRFNLKKFEFRTRVFGQIGFGDIPLESTLYLASANQEQMLDNRFTQARGFVPNDWLGYGANYNHFHMGGGLNLRGFAGYLAPEIHTINGQEVLIYNYYGNSGAAFNVEIDFDKYIKIPAKGITKNFKVDTYLFSDLGILNTTSASKNYFGKFRLDAGIGSAVTFKFGPYDMKPVTLRFDMPIFVNTPPAVSDYFKLRYVIGINRAF